MATDMILPALGMAQDTGKVVQWLKAAGEQVQAGEAVVEVETDKATVELEAPATGILVHLVDATDAAIPVGQVIARILAVGESVQVGATPVPFAPVEQPAPSATQQNLAETVNKASNLVSPLAARIAAEHHLDLHAIKPVGRRIQKADVLSYIQQQERAVSVAKASARLTPASPKARRMAVAWGVDLATVRGSGPEGAVLVADMLATTASAPQTISQDASASGANGSHDVALSNIWRIMAERTTQSWTSVPHFFLLREINASRLIAWREQLLKRLSEKVTYTDLLVKIVATALHEHPRLNAAWQNGVISLNDEINIGIAAAIEDGLVVPVIQHADQLSLSEIAQQRKSLIARAQAGKLRPQDIQGGTFTISNLGMYGVDAFTAIINPPQSAILAVSRMAERVVAIHGQPVVQPMLVCSLSCDHRVIDGARGAQFLTTLAELIEEPLGLLV